MGLPLAAGPEDDVSLVVADLAVARAYYEGVPSARLLARVQLARDETDLDNASWDITIARLVGTSPTSHDRLKKSIARHTRAAADEGPLPATDAEVAALVFAHLTSSDVDASIAEGMAEQSALEDDVRRACLRLDDRLGTAHRRASGFEACIALTTRHATSPFMLAEMESALVLVPQTSPLYPAGDEEIPEDLRRACALDRAALERPLLLSARERDAAVARLEHSERDAAAKIGKEALALLGKQGAALIVAPIEPRSVRDAPPVPPSSWIPQDMAHASAAQQIAAALERGSTTAPRARALLSRSGDAVLDAIGREMLDVSAHPYASAVFADVLAAASRERDVVRLVTYFAIAPDPAPAAHALSTCRASEVPNVLRAYLESMLPADGGITPVGNIGGERIAACIAALRPYPRLYGAVKPLLSRLSEAPPRP